MESNETGARHGAAARKRASRIVFVARENAWTGCDFLSSHVMAAGHYVLGFARGLMNSPRERPRPRRR